MYRKRCVLALVALYVGLVQSWDIAVSKGNLLEFYTNDTKTNAMRFNSHNLTALAYNDVYNMMLYVDKQINNDAVCGFDMSSMENKCFIERSGRNIHGIAFDPVTELLFFSDTNERTVNWISLKRRSNNNIYGNLLIKMDDGIPTDIAVDSSGGYVYWINKNLATPVIEKARFNGSERQVVINSNSVSINTTHRLEPHGLAIDQQTQKMYWIQPKTSSKFSVYCADLDGKNKNKLGSIKRNVPSLSVPLTNTLAVTKTNLFSVDWCSESECEMQVLRLPKTSGTSHRYTKFTLSIEQVTVGVAANYKIEDKSQNSKDCEPLTSLARNNSDGPFCVHGIQINGQSHCKCTPGYIGERCDVSVCESYCLQGNCSFNDEGLPKCRCNAGYSGDRCEVNVCHGYCLNNGDCSLNEKREPVCECKGDYLGDRCEVSDCLNYCLKGNCSFSEEGHPECRCNVGYSGDRCEVDVCHGYCLNNGDCSLNEKREPVCECKGDYLGDRCEVSDCLNYCLQGNCSFSEEGHPECRCNIGYSGDRCEVDVCYGYCLNNGDCSLNEEDDPFCQCVGNHEGTRCELVPKITFTFTNTPTYAAEANQTLADLLLNWRKPTAKIFVIAQD